jgi:hypothetical protein
MLYTSTKRVKPYSGQGRWPKHVGVLCSKYKNIVQLVGSESWVIFSYLRKDFYIIPTSVSETSCSFASSDVLKILNHSGFIFFYSKYTRLCKKSMKIFSLHVMYLYPNRVRLYFNFSISKHLQFPESFHTGAWFT